MEYSHNYLVHYYEIDNKNKLTLPTLIHYLEDIAILHSDDLGYSLEYFDESHQGFMLLKWSINIYQWPKFKQTVHLKTTPYSFKKFLANRAFKAYDPDGNLIADADTVWVFCDTKTRRPVRVSDEMHNNFGVTTESANLFSNLDDVEPITEGAYKTQITVQKTDIDTNNHVNNVRYIEWALQSLPDDFISTHAVTSLRAHYKKELQLGDQAELVSDIVNPESNLTTRHSFYNQDKEICHLKLEWKSN